MDLQPIDDYDLKLVNDVLDAPWISEGIESIALKHASEKLVPEHYEEVRTRRERQATKILAAVNERLVKEINYWSDRYIKLSADVEAGKQPRVQPEMLKKWLEPQYVSCLTQLL